jgi:hypothetical protein
MRNLKLSAWNFYKESTGILKGVKLDAKLFKAIEVKRFEFLSFDLFEMEFIIIDKTMTIHKLYMKVIDRWTTPLWVIAHST